jgi:hypothetical protein
MKANGQGGIAVLRAWWAMRSQKRRRLARGGQVEVPLPALAHHPGAGVPGQPLHDDVYPAENPGALLSDSVEIWVLDPSLHNVQGPEPTEAEWVNADMTLLPYSEALGRWHYQSADVGATKSDGDSVWIRARWRRAGQAGPWSSATVVWSY